MPADIVAVALLTSLQDEDEEKNKLKEEIEHMAQDPENEEYIPLDAPPTTNGSSTSTSAEDTPNKKDKKLRNKALDQIMEQELGPSITANGQHIEAEAAAEKKRKRKEEKRAEKRKREAEEEEAEEAEAPVTGTLQTDAGAKAEDETETGKEKKKKRKIERTSDEKEEAEIETPAAKKDKKKKDKEPVTEESEAAELADASEESREKKDKKKKKKEKKEKQPAEEYVSAPIVESEAKTNGGEQWNVSQLEGDAKRKQKFLRLLGGGKADGLVGSNHTASTSSRTDIVKMQSDLERQFDVGMKMKQEGHGHRKGLGA